MNVLSTAYNLTQKTRYFIAQFKGNSCVEKWAKSSLADLSECILKKKIKLLEEQREEQAQRRAQRQGRSGIASAAAQLYSKSGGLHGASKLCDKVLTPQQKESLNEYMNTFNTAMNYFQRWVCP